MKNKVEESLYLISRLTIIVIVTKTVALAEVQTHRSMKHKGELRNRPTQAHPTHF